MKMAPLHLKINCLAIQQQGLINYGNKFAKEIYATVIRAHRHALVGTGTAVTTLHSLPIHSPMGIFKCFQKLECRSFISLQVSSGAPLASVMLRGPRDLPCHRQLEAWPSLQQHRDALSHLLFLWINGNRAKLSPLELFLWRPLVKRGATL